ncbi:MAG: hypothetical protein C0467_09785 [Planctomycetaceae bacterium]|nr:hypothetical protein [Planctomycetaceae bacterium]
MVANVFVTGMIFGSALVGFGGVTWSILYSRANSAGWVVDAGLLVLAGLGISTVPGVRAKTWFVAGRVVGFVSTLGGLVCFARACSPIPDSAPG